MKLHDNFIKKTLNTDGDADLLVAKTVDQWLKLCMSLAKTITC